MLNVEVAVPYFNIQYSSVQYSIFFPQPYFSTRRKHHTTFERQYPHATVAGQNARFFEPIL
jgi:hypothetical protein